MTRNNKLSTPNLKPLLAVLKAGKTFCFTGHQGPDADVIGSQLALRSLVKWVNPQAKISICNAGPVPSQLMYLKGIENVQNVTKVPGEFDVLVVFECSGADRTGNIIDFKRQVKTVVNLDHHLHNPNFGHINFVEPSTSSTSELVFKIFRAAKKPINKDEAISLYTGLVADTGWFRYGNTNTQTHQIASELLSAGVDVADLSERFYLSRSEAAVRLLAYTLEQMKLYFDNRLACLKVPIEIFKKLNAKGDDVEDIVNHGLLMESVQVSLLLKERGDGIVKVSLRSKGELDINLVARAFGGGGHRNASGCEFKGSLDEAEKQIVAELEKIF